jgi:alkylated DNA repair dioxygenase AlkB
MDAIEHHLSNADIYIVHQYVKETKQLFEYLKANLKWSRDGRSLRSPAYCNMGTDYLASSGKLRIGQELDPMVLKLMSRLNDELNVMMNSCFAIFYETEQAELAYRAQPTLSLDPDQPILTIFLGAPSKTLFKDITSAEEFDFELLVGDLLIMPDHCQKNYLNAIRKSDSEFSPRISLSFRRFNDGAFY